MVFVDLATALGQYRGRRILKSGILRLRVSKPVMNLAHVILAANKDFRSELW